MSEVEVTVSEEAETASETTGELPGATEALIDRVVEDAAESAQDAQIDASIATAASDSATDSAIDAAAAADTAISAANESADNLTELRSLIETIPGAVVSGLRDAAKETVQTPATETAPPNPADDTPPARGHWLNKRWGRN